MPKTDAADAAFMNEGGKRNLRRLDCARKIGFPLLLIARYIDRNFEYIRM
jgi:hypothetical protein